MSSVRKTALVAGILYLVTFASSIPALLLLGPILHDSHFVLGDGSVTRVLCGTVLDLVNAAAAVGTAVTLFPVLKRQNEAVALGLVAARVLEAAAVVIGTVCLLAVVTLRRDPAGTDSATLVATGRVLVAVRDRTFLLGPGLMPGANALLLATLLVRARLVPRWIPAVGLAGAPLLFVAAGLTLFGVLDQVSPVAGLLNFPIALWEFAVGVCMAVRGFRPSPVTAVQ